ncbi:macro domain-containing protein [Paenibacillus humicola]|uniref:macro domain-containing protein n=1 Tax=Paenibacillus humicola TaxID=3110540 RepID=UPI00237A3242|nr:macro domain-containing protein [Paenibacillus humicola]
MNVPLFDKKIIHTFYGFLSVISVITSIVFLFVEIDPKSKMGIGGGTLAFLVLVYTAIWIHANMRRSIKLTINTSEIEVKFGDIFSEKADFKAIAFNEYFDTLVDEKVISSSSLNGIYIKKFYQGNTSVLDNIISSDPHLPEMIVCENAGRTVGKKTKYRLGTICMVDDYLLTALSRFDDNNKAYLEMNDYINCLLNFWNEIDRVYAGRTVALPVLGSGITRFRGYENILDQELLELIILTFKVSRIKFAYPSKVKIIVWQKKQEKINLFALKDLES